MAKNSVANVSLSIVDFYVTYTKCPPLDISFFFFGDQNLFYGDHFTIDGRQKVTFWKRELGALLWLISLVHVELLDSFLLFDLEKGSRGIFRKTFYWFQKKEDNSSIKLPQTGQFITYPFVQYIVCLFVIAQMNMWK